MEKEILEKYIVILLLLNKNKPFQKSYDLVKVLSRWFNIIDLKFLDKMVDENLLVCNVLDRHENYFLTEKAKDDFYSNKYEIEKELKTVFTEQLNAINTLMSNID